MAMTTGTLSSQYEEMLNQALTGSSTLITKRGCFGPATSGTVWGNQYTTTTIPALSLPGQVVPLFDLDDIPVLLTPPIAEDDWFAEPATKPTRLLSHEEVFKCAV